jgi:heme/copper-type cytochrome/quinol oxidase subunit 2
MDFTNRGKWILAVVVVGAGFTLPAFTTPAAPQPQRRDFNIIAHKYAYDPSVIKVNQGDEVHIKFSSRDVTHGFFLEGYDIDALSEAGKTGILFRHPSLTGSFAPSDEIVFTADKRGKFRYRCSMTCGYMHPFMMGVMIVQPNSLFGQALGLMTGILLAGFILVWPARFPALKAQTVAEVRP